MILVSICMFWVQDYQQMKLPDMLVEQRKY